MHGSTLFFILGSLLAVVRIRCKHARALLQASHVKENNWQRSTTLIAFVPYQEQQPEIAHNFFEIKTSLISKKLDEGPALSASPADAPLTAHEEVVIRLYACCNELGVSCAELHRVAQQSWANLVVVYNYLLDFEMRDC